MKIEIGESIVYSWLRHIKNCQIVQSNWKVSPEWPQANNIDKLQAIMDRAIIEFDNPFKKTQRISQLFRQAEIDAIGINLKKQCIYAADIAFHEGGLSYGDKEETVKRITKKIIRTVLVLQHYFSNIPNQKIFFVSPKINPESLVILESAVLKISKFIENEPIKCEITLISNSKFKDEIFNPILHLSKNIADTSELFLRSIQLANLFKTNEITTRRRIRRQVQEETINNHRGNADHSTSEIKKIKRRVPGWFKRSWQYNSTILIGYLELAQHHDLITVEMLRDRCQAIPNFWINYTQMKNFGEQNHGKVFQETNGTIILWEPVKHFILEQYGIYRNTAQ